MSRISGIVCSSPVYHFEGWTFEINKISGPWPCTALGNPFKRAGNKFWDMIDKFNSIPSPVREEFCIDRGGCMRFKS